jgi:hypothetical protein
MVLRMDYVDAFKIRVSGENFNAFSKISLDFFRGQLLY